MSSVTFLCLCQCGGALSVHVCGPLLVCRTSCQPHGERVEAWMPQQLRLDLNCSTSQSASQSVSQSAPVFCVSTMIGMYTLYISAVISHQSVSESVSESVSQSVSQSVSSCVLCAYNDRYAHAIYFTVSGQPVCQQLVSQPSVRLSSTRAFKATTTQSCYLKSSFLSQLCML